MLAFCSSARFFDHDTGPHHPEHPDRLRAVLTAVRQCGLVASPNPLPELPVDLPSDLAKAAAAVGPLVEIEPQPIDESWLTSVHGPELIARIEHVCEVGGGTLDLGDTPVGPKSYETALLALGAMQACCDAVMTGRVRRAFAAVRPPGHHAEPDRAMGFCLFNNVAFAARYAKHIYDVGRIAIVDFDVHHGNGTQAVFEAENDVLFISLHQHPRTCYPGSGYEWERGVGAGRGSTINLPFDPGAGDEEYLNAFDAKVVPALDSFRPELLLLSAGFDAHRDDPLAHIDLSDDAFEQMTRRLVAVAEAHCGGRIVSALEGGYNLQALGRCVVRHLIGMAGTDAETRGRGDAQREG